MEAARAALKRLQEVSQDLSRDAAKPVTAQEVHGAVQLDVREAPEQNQKAELDTQTTGCTPAAMEVPSPSGVGEAELPQSQRSGGPKRKVALYLGYNGTGYSGMQFNPGVPTIEKTLEEAIFLAGGISQNNMHDPRKVHWMRAARTDKGVSACGQVVSLRMMLEPEGMIERINSHLPDQIRVFGFRRTTTSFDARKLCDYRRYEYCLPEWVFDPDVIPARPGWRPASSSPTDARLPDDSDEAPAAVTTVGGKQVRIRQGYSLSGPPTNSRFVFDDECCKRLADILAQYCETHNFHNFSPAVLATQMAAKRHILSFKCLGVFNISVNGQSHRWVRTEVVGQSFLLNQIRKMVGLAIAVYRGVASWDHIEMALDPNRNFSTPMAPALGLHLAECIYASYNRRFGVDREILQLDLWQEDVDKFKAKWIYPMLVTEEAKEYVNWKFVETLTDDVYMFSKWKFAKAVRNEPRPKSKADRQELKRQRRNTASTMKDLIKAGMPEDEARVKAKAMAEEDGEGGRPAKQVKTEDDESAHSEPPAAGDAVDVKSDPDNGVAAPEAASEGTGELPAGGAGVGGSAEGGSQPDVGSAVPADAGVDEVYEAPVVDEEERGGLLGDDDCVPEENYENEHDSAAPHGRQPRGGRGRGNRGRGRGRGRRGDGRW